MERALQIGSSLPPLLPAPTPMPMPHASPTSAMPSPPHSLDAPGPSTSLLFSAPPHLSVSRSPSPAEETFSDPIVPVGVPDPFGFGLTVFWHTPIPPHLFASFAPHIRNMFAVPEAGPLASVLQLPVPPVASPPVPLPDVPLKHRSGAFDRIYYAPTTLAQLPRDEDGDLASAPFARLVDYHRSDGFKNDLPYPIHLDFYDDSLQWRLCWAPPADFSCIWADFSPPVHDSRALPHMTLGPNAFMIVPAGHPLAAKRLSIAPFYVRRTVS
jgi:hypothetical protein